MKKVTINFILSLVFVVALTILTVISASAYSDIRTELKKTSSDISADHDYYDEIEDISGYALLAKNFGVLLGAFGVAILLAVAIALGLYAFLLFLFALIAKLVYRPEGGRLMAYRILMTIEYLFQGGIAYFLGGTTIDIISEGHLTQNDITYCIVMIILTLTTIGLILYSAVNTYSSKIKQA